MQNRANIKPPEGWEWLDDWQVDINRAVDEEGIYTFPSHNCFLNHANCCE